jgi:hypothetical protein
MANFMSEITKYLAASITSLILSKIFACGLSALVPQQKKLANGSFIGSNVLYPY